MASARAQVDEILDGDFAVVFDGLDDAIVGIAQQFTGDRLVVYDRDLILKILERNMPANDAHEYFSFNIEGLWAGDRTPLIMERVTDAG